MKDLYIRMIQTLQEYKHTPEDRLIHYMSERLDKSLDTYNTELSTSIEYLGRREPSKMVRKIINDK